MWWFVFRIRCEGYIGGVKSLHIGRRKTDRSLIYLQTPFLKINKGGHYQERRTLWEEI